MGTADGELRRLAHEVVRGYIIGQVRHLADGQPELFERGLRLYSLVESEVLADGTSAGDRIRGLLEHPVSRTIQKLVSRRIQGMVDAAVQGMRDNRAVMTALTARLASEPPAALAGKRGRLRVEALYRDVLVGEVPIERSLANVAAIATSTRLLHEMMSARSLVKRALRREGMSFVRRIVLRTPAAREELDALWASLEADPDQLLELAASVEAHGPTVVDRIYDPS